MESTSAKVVIIADRIAAFEEEAVHVLNCC